MTRFNHTKIMTTLIVGASGATGKLLVEQLLQSGQRVKVIIRPTSKIPNSWNSDENVTIIEEEIIGMNVNDMVSHLDDCHAAASCLGHNLTWKGIYGSKNLVTDAIRLVSEASTISKPQKPIKFVLMNTAGNSNRDLEEPISFGEKILVGLIRLLLPPHRDNEKAADYLRGYVGQKNPNIAWVAVRPDSLINHEKVTRYSLHGSPMRSAIFNPGKTSRINVAHFMAKLITDETTWNTWNGQMPVIYDDVNEV